MQADRYLAVSYRGCEGALRPLYVMSPGHHHHIHTTLQTAQTTLTHTYVYSTPVSRMSTVPHSGGSGPGPGVAGWRMEGSHTYLDRHYMPFMPPSIIQAASTFPACSGDVLFGTYPRSGTALAANFSVLFYYNTIIESKTLRWQKLTV